MTELCFVLAPRQNHFFVELVEALRDELDQLGVRSWTSNDGFPAAREGLAYVLVPPHEYVALSPPSVQPTTRELARCVVVCAEQPGTKFFDANVTLARAGAGAVLDINSDAVRELRSLGVAADHAPVGWTRGWARSGAAPSPERPLDVLHLGIHTPRRAAALAAFGPALSLLRADLRLADPTWTNVRGRAGFVVDEAKWALLARARMLLNLHAEERTYFETLRVVQAMCSGALVVTEHASGMAPFEPGVHLLAGRLETLGQLAAHVGGDEPRRAAMANAAERFLREELPLRRAAETLAQRAEEVAARPVLRARSALPLGPVAPPAAIADEAIPAPPAPGGQGGAKTPGAVVRQARGHRDGEPLVSVVVVLRDERDRIASTLDAVAASGRTDVEIVVCDDGSADGSADVVAAWSAASPDIALVLVRHAAPRGPTAARATALAHVRGGLVLLLGASVRVYPSCVDRLVEALDEAPAAALAYAMVAVGEADALVGWSAWEPGVVGSGGGQADLALWRVRALRGPDDRDVGNPGETHGQHVAQVLARAS